MITISLSSENHFGKLLSEVIGSIELVDDFLGGKRGRPRIYTPPMIIKAFLIMVCYRLTSVRSLARFLEEQPQLAKLCGFGKSIPCYRTLCRRFKSLDNWILEYCRIFITYLIDASLVKLDILIIDGTPAKSKCKKPQRRKEFKNF